MKYTFVIVVSFTSSKYAVYQIYKVFAVLGQKGKKGKKIVLISNRAVFLTTDPLGFLCTVQV